MIQDKPRHQSPYTQNVNHKRQDSDCRTNRVLGDAAQVGPKSVAQRKAIANRNRRAGPAPEKVAGRSTHSAAETDAYERGRKCRLI
jgi:hypothetical protein